MIKKNYRVVGLDCAHCAAKIEESLKKTKGINSCTLNFMTAKISIAAEDGMADSLDAVVRDCVKKYEPSVEVKRG